MKKRALSLLLVFAMILSFVPTTALAAGGEENEITISETPSTDNQEGEPSTSNDSVEPGEGDAVGTANTEDQTDSETGSDAEASSAGTAREGNEITDGNITTVEQLKAAVASNATGTNQLTLQNDIDVPSYVMIERSVTLDLNNYTLRCKDKGGYAPLYIYPDYGDAIEVTVRNGKIVVEKDCAYYGIWVVGDVKTLNLEDLTITNNNALDGMGAFGMMIDHESYVSSVTTVSVKHSTITGDGGISVYGSAGQEGDEKNPNPSLGSELTRSTGVILSIDSTSTVESKSPYGFAAISGNGLDRTNPSIIIEGTIEGNDTAAIYLPQYGTTTVKAGAKISGQTGIAMKSGKLIINGGTITGTGDYEPDPKLYDNGVNSDGAAVFLESYAPPYAGKMEITIGKDATLTSNESYALRENPNSEQTAIQKITIENGAKLNASSAKAITTPIDLLDTAADKIEIKGGTYSHPVKYEYLGNLLWQAGEGPYTYYSSWEAAQTAGATKVTQRIANEATTDPLITLNYNDGGAGTKDFAVTYRIPSGQDFTFPDDPDTTKTTKAFAGWKNDTTTSDTKLYKVGNTMPGVTKDITLTATWSDKGPEVIFDTPQGITLSAITNLMDETTEDSKPLYTVADKTKDVTFNLSNTPANQEITVTSQIGTNNPQDLSKDKDGNYVLPKTLFTGNVSRITVTVSLDAKKTVTFDFSKLTTGQTQPTVNPTANLDGSNSPYTVIDKTKSATFELTGNVALNYTVKYKVGETGTELTLEPENKVYTLPANLEGNVIVTVTATAKNTITLDIDDNTAKDKVTSIAPATEGSNLEVKDGTASPKVYVANDDTKSISFTVTEESNATYEPDEGIVVKYKLVKDADSAYTTLSAQSVSADKHTYTYTLKPEAITGDIIVKVFVGATPVYKAEPNVSGSTTATTITTTEVSANIEAAKAQDEPLTIKATTETTTVTKSEVKLDGNLIQTITSTGTNVDLAVETDVGTVELPSETVSEIVKDNNLTASDPLTVKVEKQDDQIVGAIAETGATNLFDVTLMSGTKEVNAEDLGLTLRITLTFTIEIGLKNPKLYRFEDGKGIELSDVRYDPTTGKISGKTDHLSQFYVVIAPDTTIRSILGNGVVTEGKGGVSAPEAVIVQVPSGEGQPPVISATNILTTDENATVTLYSDSGFRTTVPASGKALVDGPNVVYATVKNGGVDNQSTSYYEITVIKEVAETDCSLDTVLGQLVNTAGGSGSKGDPYVVTVVSDKTELTASADIKANVASATVKFYNDDNTFTDEALTKVDLKPTNGIAIVYATVTNGGKTVYYQIEVTGTAVATVVPEIKDGTIVPGTATTGCVRNWMVVSDNPAATIASWNKATTKNEAETALQKLNNNASSLGTTVPTLSATDNGHYLVLVDTTSGGNNTIVAAGSTKIELPVAVTIDKTGLASGDTLTITNGSTPITTTETTVPYGTILEFTLSDANYVVYANADVVSMNGTEGKGTYKVVGTTNFSVVAGHSVEIINDSNANLEVKHNTTGAKDIYLSKGVSMVPHGANLAIELSSNHILMVDGVEKTLTSGKTSVTVNEDTKIEVVPGYTVTISNDASNVTLQVMAGETEINGGDMVAEGTVLTIGFVDLSKQYKVQINGKDVTLVDNACSHTVTATTAITVVPQDESSVVDELNVAVSTSGDVTVTKGSTPVTDAKFILTTKLPLPELTDDLTEDEVLTKVDGESSYLDRALTASDSGKYLVAVQFSEDGNLIAAGISGKITVSSPTTTTGYTVSGTVSKGETSATVAGILVTLKGADVTKTTTVKADGTYEFVGVDAGTYTVAIALNAASKYDAIDKEVVVDSDETVDITLVVFDPINNWDPLEITSAPIGESERATFTVSNMKAGMYYCITIGTDDTAPSDQFFQADKDFWSFVTDKNSTIYVVEFGSPITFDENGMVDITDNSRYRRADNTDNAE